MAHNQQFAGQIRSLTRPKLDWQTIPGHGTRLAIHPLAQFETSSAVPVAL